MYLLEEGKSGISIFKNKNIHVKVGNLCDEQPVNITKHCYKFIKVIN